MPKFYQTKLYYFSDENNKLRATRDTVFFIWNLPARRTCPNATKHCSELCYAVKAETCYPDCLPCRMRNWTFSKSPEFVDTVTALIRRRRKYMRKDNLIVRIHESGDFYSKEYADKWAQIARNCADLDGVTFIAYTKSFKFFDGVNLPDNFTLRASVWDDTKPEDLEIIARNNWPIYTAVEKFTRADNFHQCRCEDCATCGKCWSKTPLIACEIH